MKDCRECANSMLSYAKLMCVAQSFPKPVEFMRDERSMCGLEGRLFEEKQDRKYAEYE